MSSDYFRRKETKAAEKMLVQEFYFSFFITLHERKTKSLLSDSDSDSDGGGDSQIKKLVSNNAPKSTKEQKKNCSQSVIRKLLEGS